MPELKTGRGPVFHYISTMSYCSANSWVLPAARPAFDEVGEHRQALRFFVEEEVDRRSSATDDAVFASVELARLAQQFPEDFVQTVRAVFTSPRPSQVGQGSQSTCASDSGCACASSRRGRAR